jgi:hypothetical protein
MPSAICQTCGRWTNSVVSNYFVRSKTKALEVVTECYAAYVDGIWVKGCSYDRLSNDKYSPKHYADKLINESANKKDDISEMVT